MLFYFENILKKSKVFPGGNSGNDSWGIITAPADADSVLSIGAVSRIGEYASFSSRGNTADGRIKPDVVAVSLMFSLSYPFFQIVIEEVKKVTADGKPVFGICLGHQALALSE